MSGPMHIALHDGPLPARRGPVLFNVSQGGVSGAVVCFEGVVRSGEGGECLMALEYEVYEPMTSRQLRALCCEVVLKHGLHTVELEHSVGVVPVGGVSFRLVVASAHRKAALLAMDELIDQMKREVAIWKRPVWASAEQGGERA